MSIALLVVGALSVALTFVHLVAGGRQCARPMLDAEFDQVAKLTLYVCWHYVTVHLLLGGALLLWAGVEENASLRAAALVVSASFLAMAAVFLTVAAKSRRSSAWYDLGQWMIFLPMGVAGILGSL